MGFLSGIFKKEVDREATSLDVFFVLTGLYYGFYEKYGYDKHIDPTSMGGLYLESLKKSKLVLNSLPDTEVMGAIEFVSHVAIDSGKFPILLKEFKKIPVDINSNVWKKSLENLLNEMNSKGFNSGLSFS